MERITVIDLVRTFSILAVMAHHLGLLALTQSPGSAFLGEAWYKFWAKGWMGVPLFFVVSGYLITRLIATRPGGLFRPDYREFYARRAGRILPLLALVCVLGLVLASAPWLSSEVRNHFYRVPEGGAQAPFWISIATFWMNWYGYLFPGPLGLHWGLLWSLAIEEQFYLFYPLALRKLGKARNLILFLLFFIFLGAAVQALGVRYLPRTGLDGNSFSGFGLIAMGCLLYVGSERYKAFLSRHSGWFTALAWAGLVLALAVYLRPQYKADFFGRSYGHSLFGLGTGLFLLGALRWKFLKTGFWSVVGLPGRLSYGLYLLHATALYLLYPLWGRLESLQAFLVFSAATVALAYLSYRLFEKPANLYIRAKLGPGKRRGAHG